MPETSPTLLLARAQRGDEIALAELVHTYRKPLERVAARMVGPSLRPHLDSDDLIQSVQQTFLVGLRGGKFELSSLPMFLGLALTLVRRSVSRQWRALKRQAGVAERSSIAAPAVARKTTDDDPAQSFQRTAEIETILASLDVTDRRLLELRLQGYSTADVARKTGLDAGYLRVRLIRLRKRLIDRGLVKRAPVAAREADGKPTSTAKTKQTVLDIEMKETWCEVPFQGNA